MLASTCKTVSWYVIALRLALAGCAAQSPTSRIRTNMRLRRIAAARTQNMVALNVANARIYMQNSLMVCNRTAPCACGLCSAVPDFTHPNQHASSTDCSCGQGCSLFESAFYVLCKFVLNLGPIQLPPP